MELERPHSVPHHQQVLPMTVTRRILLLLPLVLFYCATEFWWESEWSFHFMARFNEPFSLWEMFRGAWGNFLPGRILQNRSAIILAVLCVLWWLKPSHWLYLLLALFVFTVGSMNLLVTWSGYNRTLYEYPEYRQQIPSWFPLSPITFR